jgi:hypothetical protein
MKRTKAKQMSLDLDCHQLGMMIDRVAMALMIGASGAALSRIPVSVRATTFVVCAAIPGLTIREIVAARKLMRVVVVATMTGPAADDGIAIFVIVLAKTATNTTGAAGMKQTTFAGMTSSVWGREARRKADPEHRR